MKHQCQVLRKTSGQLVTATLVRSFTLRQELFDWLQTGSEQFSRLSLTCDLNAIAITGRGCLASNPSDCFSGALWRLPVPTQVITQPKLGTDVEVSTSQYARRIDNSHEQTMEKPSPKELHVTSADMLCTPRIMTDTTKETMTNVM